MPDDKTTNQPEEADGQGPKPPTNPVEFATDVLGINLYPLQAVVAANSESINSTYFIPGNLFARPRSQPSACRK